MSYEFLGSTSSMANLTVGYPPFGQIIDYRVPPAARRGDRVETATLVRNTGDLPGNFYMDLWDADTGEPLAKSGVIGLGAGEQAWFYITGGAAPVMPNRGLELIVQTHHDGAIDDMQQKRVPLLVAVATALSISIDPAIVAPGGSYTQSGRLTRVDTGAGVGGEAILLYRDGVMLPTRATTDGAGNYALSITAPTTVGTYSCQSEFLGSIELGLGPSSASSLLEITPLPPEIPDYWPWIVGGIFATIGLVVAAPAIAEEAKKKGWIK